MPRIFPFVLVVIVYGVISSSCDDSAASLTSFEKRSATANEVLVSNWKLWFKSVDVNHDRIVTTDDMEESMNIFTALLEELDYKKVKQVVDTVRVWFLEYVFRNNPGELTEKQFVDAVRKDYEDDKEAFRARMEKCFNIFAAVDIDNDGFLSQEEFLILIKAYGHKNAALDTKLFEAYNPIDGKVPVSTIVDTWVDFVCNDDPSKGNIVTDGFESGV